MVADPPTEIASVPVVVSPGPASQTAPAVVAAAPRPAFVTPLAPERYKVQFTVGPETHEKLRRAQDLLRHVVPNGDPAEIFNRALTRLLAQLEKTKLASAKRSHKAAPVAASSRHIPAAVKRTVWARDGGRCAFVGREGRCAERGFLEFHHVVPYAHGGAATVDNIELACRAHNQFAAEDVFGPRELSGRERPRGTPPRPVGAP